VEDQEDGRFGDMTAAAAAALTAVLEQAAVSEVERRVGCRLYERGTSRSDYRNGYRFRALQTAFAILTLRIPRLRGQGYVPAFFEENHRAVRQLEDWVADAFTAGVSRAAIIRVLESTTGCRPSEGLIKRVCSRMDADARAFKERELTGRYRYLFLDAAWVKDIVGSKAGRICVLTAIGITYAGRKEILGFERARIENATAWRGFLMRLKERGLRSRDLDLVISDEHGGILVAVQEMLGDVAHQLCWAHRVRNAMDTLARAGRKSDRHQFAQDLRSVYDAPHRTAAVGAFRALRQKWMPTHAALVTSIGEDMHHLLAFYGCPELHRAYVRTTNPIERLFVELRRARFASGAFANTTSCDRVVANVYIRLNARWRSTDIWFVRERKRQQEAVRRRDKAGTPTSATARAA
jgi:transposase-like protein